MITEQITADIVRIRVGGWPGVNVYLIEEPDGLTVVDTGFFLHGKTLARAAGGRPVRRIVLTHFHPDHSGGCAELQRLTGAPVLVHELDRPFVQGTRRIEDEPGWWVTRFMLRMVRLVGMGSTASPARLDLLREGDRLGRLQVLHTPGHTPGHCSFWDGKETLFCGDNLVNMSRFGTGIPIWTLDHAAQKQSIARYRGLGVRLVLSGHGRPWRGDLDGFLA